MRLLYPILGLLLTMGTLNAQSFRTEVISKKLMEKIAAEPEAFHSVNIILSDRADLATLDAELSGRRATASERSHAVITALKDKSAATQRGLLETIEHSPYTLPGTVRSYWIANAVFGKLQKELIAEISWRSDVEWIGLNGKLKIEKFEKSPPPPVVPNGIEPGLAVINAPAMWAMGYTGYGQIAFTNDTGIDPTHPAIASRYRGLYVPREHTWFEIDSVSLEPNGNYTPFDCQSHGTHVTGTILGLDRTTNDTIGVAFNSQWIGAPILCGIGTEDNVAAFQWSLDPDADPNTADDIPDIINNSWYDPHLDTTDCFSVYLPVLEAMEAIGIAVIFSAGNEGPGTLTITPPHNINLNELNSFTVGALNGNLGSLPIASFSSRGPSQCGGDSSLLIKPEVSAPGVSVRSCVPGNDYDFFSGTSMASPHVSGAILLLKEAFPNLTGKQLKEAIYLTCTDLGVPGEDNTYGMGVINVLETFNYLVSSGHVPVSPWRANDIMFVDLKLPDFSCKNEIRPILTAENAGTDTLHSFQVAYAAGPFTNTFEWTGILAPGQRTTFGLPALAADPGDYELVISVEKPNGLDDERPLNNRFILPVKVADRPYFEAEVSGTNGTVCENTQALLRGVFPASLANGTGQLVISWYDALYGGNLLHYGEAYLTPPLAEPTTFYAEASYLLKAGMADKNAGTNDLMTTNEMGLNFEVFADVTLKTVRMYVEQTGGRVIRLADMDGELVYQDLVFINETGEVRVDLDWEIPPGNYQILKMGGKPAYANGSGADYPYSADDIVNITGPTDDQVAPDAYFYFYDWEIEYREPCGRTAVPVEVSPGGNLPTASFTASADTIYFNENEPFSFTNTTTGGLSWTWNFGDGNGSTEESPSHIYNAPGTYLVSMTATGADGCSASMLYPVHVAPSAISNTRPVLPDNDQVEVFPNPADHTLTVHLDLTSARNITLQLADITGRIVRTADFPTVQQDKLRLQVHDLPEGVYFLLVDMGGRTSVWKVVKI